jgi:diaminopropionate ammonia-lyase
MESSRLGSAASIPPARSVMDGLVVGRASPYGWPVLRDHAFAFLAVPDNLAVEALDEAAAGAEDDPRLAIGETGIAGWAGFLAARRAPRIAAALGLDADSRIAIIASEGTTDPEVYRRLTGRAPKDDSLESDYVA